MKITRIRLQVKIFQERNNLQTIFVNLHPNTGKSSANSIIIKHFRLSLLIQSMHHHACSNTNKHIDGNRARRNEIEFLIEKQSYVRFPFPLIPRDSVDERICPNEFRGTNVITKSGILKLPKQGCGRQRHSTGRRNSIILPWTTGTRTRGSRWKP